MITQPDVRIEATDDSISVVVKIDGQEDDRFDFEHPGIITGADLVDILAACGIHADYKYEH